MFANLVLWSSEVESRQEKHLNTILHYIDVLGIGETGAKPDGIRSEPVTFHRRYENYENSYENS